MKPIRVIFCFLVFGMWFSCKKPSLEGGIIEFSEDFETAADFDALFTDGIWTFYQQTEDENILGFDTTIVHSGSRSFRFYAVPSGSNVSKCDLATGALAFTENDIIRFNAWYYIDGELHNLFILDIEEPAHISSSPGVRLIFQDEGYLAAERGKMSMKTISQPFEKRVLFPTKQWVEVALEMKLSQKKKGYIKLWQDGALLIDVENIKTQPSDNLYYTQGTMGIYTNMQVGITANGNSSEVTMYVDDISIEKL